MVPAHDKGPGLRERNPGLRPTSVHGDRLFVIMFAELLRQRVVSVTPSFDNGFAFAVPIDPSPLRRWRAV